MVGYNPRPELDVIAVTLVGEFWVSNRIKLSKKAFANDVAMLFIDASLRPSEFDNAIDSWLSDKI